MVTGLYAVANGMLAQLRKQDVHAHNLANADTAGYRRQCVAQTVVLAHQAATSTPPLLVTVITGALDMTTGPIKQTGNPLDIALHGPGLLTLQTPQGRAYTRDGRLALNASRQLVSADGYPLMGQSGPITLPPGEIIVSTEGEVYVGGQKVDRLVIAEFDDATTLRKHGGNVLFASAPPTSSSNTTVTQNALEGSNVKVISEMIAMMKGLRAYEANAAALRHQDSSIQTLVRRVTAI